MVEKKIEATVEFGVSFFELWVLGLVRWVLGLGLRGRVGSTRFRV